MSPADEGPKTGACGARRCRAQIRYVRLAGGGEIPVDYTLDPAGPLIPVVVAGVRRVRARDEARDGDRPGFTPHWDSCPEPTHWERLRGEADKAGVTGPLRGRGGAEHGPCAGCKRPDHIAYGPQCQGMLCPGCTAILEAWRAAPEPRPPLRYPRWGTATLPEPLSGQP